MPGRRTWTSVEEEVLRRAYPGTPTHVIAEALERPVSQVYTKANKMGLRKAPEYFEMPASGRMRPGSTRGGATRFKKGSRPWNKGKKGYRAGGRSAETRFKPGQRPQTWVPIGSEARDPDGYLKRKVRDDAPAGQSRHNWAFVHVLLWEQHHGPVPPGHAVVFRDGNKDHLAIENLELVSRAELMERNSIHRYPDSLKRTIHAAARLRRAIQDQEACHEEQG